jgi:hypothetical protein
METFITLKRDTDVRYEELILKINLINFFSSLSLSLILKKKAFNFFFSKHKIKISFSSTLRGVT